MPFHKYASDTLVTGMRLEKSAENYSDITLTLELEYHAKDEAQRKYEPDPNYIPKPMRDYLIEWLKKADK
jgi:hypothetical protein